MISSSRKPHPIFLRAAAVAALAATLIAGCQPKQRTLSITTGAPAEEARALSEAVDLAEQAYKSGKPVEAFEKYRLAVQEYSEFPAAWNNLGVLLMDQENFLGAAEAFSTAADLSPTDPRPYYNLGLCWDRRNYLEDARKYYRKALDRDRNYLPALRGAIRADSLIGEQTDDTLTLIERALALESDDRWQKWFKLQRIRIESSPGNRGGASSAGLEKRGQ